MPYHILIPNLYASNSPSLNIGRAPFLDQRLILPPDIHPPTSLEMHLKSSGNTCKMTKEKNRNKGVKHVPKDKLTNKCLGLYSPQSQIPKKQCYYTINNSQGNMSLPMPVILLQQDMTVPAQLKHKKSF